MFTIVPRRYDTPKWQAKVAASQAFTFKDGTSVRSILELKQALMTLPEETVVFHLDPNRHDVAAWIRGAIGDTDLADAVAKQHHRWGLIVALERGLMRTLNLPPYVAKRWLQPVEESFTFQSGEKADSLQSLQQTLNQVSDTVIEFHKQRVPNDIASWVMNAIGDYELADMLEDASTRHQMIQILEDHLKMLADATGQT